MMLCTKRAENLILGSGGTVKSSYVIPTDTCICKGKTNQKFVNKEGTFFCQDQFGQKGKEINLEKKQECKNHKMK